MQEANRKKQGVAPYLLLTNKKRVTYQKDFSYFLKNTRWQLLITKLKKVVTM